MKIKKFAEDFQKIDNLKLNDKILVQDSASEKIVYATTEQLINTSGGAIDQVQQALDALAQSVENEYFANAEYISATKKIEFYSKENTKIGEIDATAFIKDGMVEEVRIEDNNLVITFNTDSGKEDIVIPLSDIFNPDNYYTKGEADAGLVDNLEIIGDALCLIAWDSSIIGQINLSAIFNSQNYFTKTEVEGLLDDKANSNDVYNKDEVDDKVRVVQDDVDGVIDDLAENYEPNRDEWNSSAAAMRYQVAVDSAAVLEIQGIEQLIDSTTDYFDDKFRTNFGSESIVFQSLIRLLREYAPDLCTLDERREFIFNVYDENKENCLLGQIKFAPNSVIENCYSVWFDTNLIGEKSWRWTRWDIDVDEVLVCTLHRVIYYTQDLQIYFPFDPNLTGGGVDKNTCGGIYGLLRDGANGNLNIMANMYTLILYALQIGLSPVDEIMPATSPTQLHQLLEIRTQIGNAFVRPCKVKIAFSSRSMADKIFYVKMDWAQVFKGSGGSSSGNLVVDEVKGVFRFSLANVTTGETTLEYKNAIITNIVND